MINKLLVRVVDSIRYANIDELNSSSRGNEESTNSNGKGNLQSRDGWVAQIRKENTGRWEF